MVLRAQTDQRLVALTRDGHDQAFGVIAERYRRELIAHARRLAPRDRCEDILQQAMLSAWEALRQQADVREARAWLHRIVHNAALSVARGSVDHEQLSDSLAATAGTEAAVERRLGATEALAALAALPQAQRRAVQLTAIEGRSGREAAAALGMNEGALRQLVHRARATMRSGVTARMPMPLVTWAAGETSETAARRISEICAGAGMTATVTKLCATVTLTATLLGGATQTLPGGHPHPSRGQLRVSPQRPTTPERADAASGTGAHVEASAGSIAPIDPQPRGHQRAQQDQQQDGSATDTSPQPHPTSAEQNATGASNTGTEGQGTSGNNDGAAQDPNPAAQANQG